VVANAAPTTTPPSTPTSRPSATKSVTRPKDDGPAALRLVKSLLPHTGAVVLILLIIGTVLAVAAMVRLSGRRGGHRA
jgi:hypothetical protein